MKVLAIIPAYNEQESIAATVKEVAACKQVTGVVVINDGSSDNTESAARQAGVDVVSLPLNLGIGGAVQTGYRYAHENGFDIAVQVDGDGQHDPSYLAALIEPLINDKADVVIGSRFLEESGGFKSTFERRMGIRFFGWLIGLLTHARISDPTSGFRACNRRMIDIYADYYPQDFPEPEAIVVARRANGRVIEQPVVMRSRLSGKSSIGKSKSVYYAFKVTLAILLYMVKQRREAMS